MKKFFSSIILIVLLVFGFTITVHAESKDVYNVVTCPGEDMATQMQLNWQSPTSIKEMSVEYTKAADLEFANKKIVKASVKTFFREDTEYAKFVGMKTPRHVWTAEIDNLDPETEYTYRIISGDKVYVDSFKFKTASKEDKDFSFLFMTDPQYYNEAGAQRFNDMAERHIKDDNIEFAFLTGDITDRGGNSDLWAMFFNKSSLSKIPYVTTVGNHEYYDKGTYTLDNTIYNNFFNNPQNGPEHLKGSAYYTLYNGVLFIMLDSEDTSYLDEQREWFRNVCDTIPARYIIVGAHRSPYAGANYFQDGQNFIKKWGYLFDECSVDLVLTGHDHMYARTKNLYNSKICQEPHKGTTYILGGSAGLKYYPHTVHTNEPLWAKWFDGITSCTVVNVNKNNISIKTVDYDGNIKDQAIIPAKRFGTVDKNFTKDEFEKSFTYDIDKRDATNGKIKWDKRAYGLVTSLKFKNINKDEQIGGTPILNDVSNYFKVDDGFLIGEINKIEITINYSDKTQGKVILEVDNQINWGTITNIRVSEVTGSSVTFSWDQELNTKFNYIRRVQLYQDGRKAKNVYITSSDQKKNEFTLVYDRKIEPLTTYKFVIEILNLNGNPVITKEFTVTTGKDLTDEEIYQNSSASIAIKAAIDNLLKALGK